jgi:hypothetical protein
MPPSRYCEKHVEGQKKDPGSPSSRGLQRLLPLLVALLFGRRGVGGWSAARMGAFRKELFSNNGTVNLTNLNGRGGRCARGYSLFGGYAAVRTEALSSISFSRASFVHCCALRRRKLRSALLLVRAAYHSHWRARSKHSAMVGDIAYLLPWPLDPRLSR